MKPLSCVVAVFSSLCCLAHAAESIAPTTFETFVAKPDARVTFSREMGAIESSDAKAKATILIVEGTGSPPATMRGVRFDLESSGGSDQVYLDEAQLRKVAGELRGIESGVEKLKSEGGAPYRVQGTGDCWMPDPRIRILCPEY